VGKRPGSAAWSEAHAPHTERVKTLQAQLEELEYQERTRFGFDHSQPYPQGDERKVINAAFDGLFRVLGSGKHLEKAIRNLAASAPTPAQIRAGNYPKQHVRFAGLPIAIENPVGSVRRGVDPNGKPWETQMRNAYGYIKGTKGLDGDHVDVFLGPDEGAEMVYVVHQKDPDTGNRDEDKVMLGFPSLAAAKAAYRAHYDKPSRFMGEVSAVPLAVFKHALAWSKVSPGAAVGIVGEVVAQG
jgi:hypothetical protein